MSTVSALHRLECNSCPLAESDSELLRAIYRAHVTATSADGKYVFPGRQSSALRAQEVDFRIGVQAAFASNVNVSLLAGIEGEWLEQISARTGVIELEREGPSIIDG
jgi:hypothetical protein